MLVAMLLALPALVPPSVHIDAAAVADPGWLSRFNAWRANAGVPILTENTTWSAGDYAHAQYMVKNDLVTHYETPGVPYYSAAGDTAARNGNIEVSSTTATGDSQAIDWWMAAPFHAMGMMDPRLKQTGFGSYRQVKSGWQAGFAVDTVRGNSFTGGTYPVYFPGNGSIEPLTSYGGGEFPDPLQACSGYAAPTGLPVFIQVGGNVATTAGAVHSFTGNGTALAHCVIDSHSPSVGSYLTSRGGVIVIPRQPLSAGVRYVVDLTVNSRVYTWSFTVGPLGAACTPGTGGAPTITSISPASGPPSGGAGVTVTGCGFTGMTGVKFGSTSAGTVNFVSDSTLTAVSPAAPAGVVDVTVTTAAGTSALTPSDRFTYKANSWCAVFDLSGVPTTWSQGVAQTFSVKATNCGTATWPNSGYNRVDMDMHFASYPGGSVNAAQWLFSLARPLASPVAPNASTTVVFTLTPSFFGHVYLEALMIKEHEFWFDTVTTTPTQFASVFVSVVRDVWCASFDLSSAPTVWVKGVAQTFSVTATNCGSTTWPNTGYNRVDMDMHFASYPGGSVNAAQWLYSLARPLASPVAPNAGTTVVFTLTPNFFGHVYLEALMVKEHEFWFDRVTSSPVQYKAIPILVSAT
jgi:hypothetical protein